MSSKNKQKGVYYKYCKNLRKGSVAHSFKQYDESLEREESKVKGNTFKWCKCPLPHKECLKHQGIDLKENAKEMKKLPTAYGGLFSRDSAERIAVGTWARHNLRGQFA